MIILLVNRLIQGFVRQEFFHAPSFVTLCSDEKQTSVEAAVIIVGVCLLVFATRPRKRREVGNGVWLEPGPCFPSRGLGT